MKHHRIRVFLGGYVNSLNAQNINCRALSEHLDKDRFEVWTMLTWYGSAKDFQRVSGVHYLYDTPCGLFEKMHLPYWLFAWLTYAIGIMRCDVAYLPKGEYIHLCRTLGRLFHCKVFSTIEGFIAGTNLKILMDTRYGLDTYRAFQPNMYAITHTISKQIYRDLGIPTQDKVLYIGVEADLFVKNRIREIRSIGNVVFIGNNIQFKGIEDYLLMAGAFPAIRFHCVGGNQMRDELLEDYILEHGIINVSYHGLLDHTQLSLLLEQMDLMYFPSRSEGFPKVMLETACAGVPTLCYGDYGADEWITTGKDGFVVNTFDEAKTVIQQLIEHPEQLQELSKNAIELGKRFDWKVLVKDWEEEIVRMVRG